MGLFDLFSKRGKPLPDVYAYDKLPKRFRNQAYHAIKDGLPDVLAGGYRGAHSGTIRQGCADKIVDTLRREHGLLQLNNAHFSDGPFGELIHYILEEEDTPLVLDAIEASFRMIENLARQPYLSREIDAQDLVKELNHRFRENGLGYYYERGNIIRIDNTVLHAEAVKPVLHVLTDPLYAGPDKELREAFRYYREGDHKGCLNECLKAFESSMKVICDRRKWAYKKDKDAAAQLIKVILDNGLIPDFNGSYLGSLNSLLCSAIPTTRNKLSGHGGGSTPKDPPAYVVQGMLHMTASTILMLVQAEKALP